MKRRTRTAARGVDGKDGRQTLVLPDRAEIEVGIGKRKRAAAEIEGQIDDGVAGKAVVCADAQCELKQRGAMN